MTHAVDWKHKVHMYQLSTPRQELNTWNTAEGGKAIVIDEEVQLWEGYNFRY